MYFGSYRTGQWQVWKKPLSGGHATQVTRKGGREAIESIDGRFLYYTRRPPTEGIWRVPVEGGEEIQVIDHGRQGRWALVGEGIGLLDQRLGPLPVIEFCEFSTEEVKQIGKLSGQLALWDDISGGMTVSPDGQWLLFARREFLSSDIMLVENFQ